VSTDLQARAFMWKDGSLYPSDEFAVEFCAKLRDGAEILLSARKPRSVRQHRLLFALLRTVVRNSDQWANERVLLDDLKVVTRLFDQRINALTGVPYLVPRSISFASMPRDEFGPWFEKAVAACADALDCTPEELLGEVEGGTREIRRRAA
jgi:hypothetical protein